MKLDKQLQFIEMLKTDKIRYCRMSYNTCYKILKTNIQLTDSQKDVLVGFIEGCNFYELSDAKGQMFIK